MSLHAALPQTPATAAMQSFCQPPPGAQQCARAAVAQMLATHGSQAASSGVPDAQRSWAHAPPCAEPPCAEPPCAEPPCEEPPCAAPPCAVPPCAEPPCALLPPCPAAPLAAPAFPALPPAPPGVEPPFPAPEAPAAPADVDAPPVAPAAGAPLVLPPALVAPAPLAPPSPPAAPAPGSPTPMRPAAPAPAPSSSSLRAESPWTQADESRATTSAVARRAVRMARGGSHSGSPSANRSVGL